MGFSIQGLGFAYSEREVLHDVSLEVPAGTLACVLGPNGAGKTTLFRCVLGLSRPSAGAVLVDGCDVATLSVAERARAMAFVPQAHEQAFDYDVLDVVLMGASSGLSALGSPGPRERRRAAEALERVGISHLARRGFAHISGGERQLTLIARALAQDARGIVMDEPTSALDFGNTARVMAQVRRLADEGLAIIASTHQPDQAYLYADTVLALDAGRVRACGPPQEVVTSELLSSLYGLGIEVCSLYDDRVRACVPVLELDRARRGSGDAASRAPVGSSAPGESAREHFRAREERKVLS